MFIQRTCWIVIAASLSACLIVRAEDHDQGKERHSKPAAEAPAHGHAEEEGVIHLNPAQLKMADLSVQPVAPGKIARTLEGPGEIVLNEDNVAHITPRVEGVAVQVRKTIGDRVGEGEVLAALESSELGNAKIEYFTARLNLDLARIDQEREQTIHDNAAKLLDLLKRELDPEPIEKQLEGAPIGESKGKLLGAYSSLRLARAAWTRSQKLIADKIISQAEHEVAAKQCESAVAEYKGAYEDVAFNIRLRLAQTARAARVAETTLQNSERRLHILGVGHEQLAAISKEKDEQVGRYELRAPFSGIIIEKHITVGEHLGTDANCFTIADLSSVWCNIRVYPKDLKHVKVGQAVRIKCGETECRQGRLSVIHPVVNEKTRAAFVRVAMENPDGQLRPGLFVTGAIVLEENEAPVVAPIAAIQTFEGQEIVFVAGDAEGEFHARPVQRGYSDGVLVEIKSGLKANEKIVVRNSFILKAELGKGEGGHEH